MPEPDSRQDKVVIKQAIPVLTYHSLDDTGSVISTSPVVFRDQMMLLRERGFRAVSLADLFSYWEDGSQPERIVALTFDDGFRNAAQYAAPVLCELGFRATLFALPGLCGRENTWRGQLPGIPKLPLLSWAELAELARSCFEIGSHGLTHRDLTVLSYRD